MKSTTLGRLSIGKVTKSAPPQITTDSLRWLLDHAAETYKNEIAATDKIKERISFILSLAVTPIAASEVYLASGLKGELFSIANTLTFWLPWGVAAGVLSCAVAFVAHALLRGFQYARAPLPSEIIKFFEQHPEPDLALNEAHLGLLNEYAKSIDHNFRQNQARSNTLLKAQRLAFLSLLFLLLSLPRWTYNAANNSPEAQPVKIVSPIEITKDKTMNKPTTPNTTNSQSKQSTEQAPSTPTQPTTAQQARPVFPMRTMVMDSASGPRETSAKDTKQEKK